LFVKLVGLSPCIVKSVCQKFVCRFRFRLVEVVCKAPVVVDIC